MFSSRYGPRLSKSSVHVNTLLKTITLVDEIEGSCTALAVLEISPVARVRGVVLATPPELDIVSGFDVVRSISRVVGDGANDQGDKGRSNEKDLHI